jgi:hypothetical protein
VVRQASPPPWRSRRPRPESILTHREAESELVAAFETAGTGLIMGLLPD